MTDNPFPRPNTPRWPSPDPRIPSPARRSATSPSTRGALIAAICLATLGIAGIIFVLARRWFAGAVTTVLVAATATAGVPAATPSPGGTSAPPTVLPTTTPVQGITDQRIDAYINHLTLNQQIGQLLMLSVYADGYNSDIDTALRQWHVANAIVFTNYGGGPLMPTTRDGMRQLISDIKAHADTPMIVATDEEGGLVDRLAPYYGPSPSPQALAATGDPQQVAAQAALDAQRLRYLGINFDFAPLADVYQGGVMDESRTFGTTPAAVIRYAGAFLDGLQQNGIRGTLKHWPGIGSENANPESALPTIMHSQAQLQADDFASFHALMAHDPGMIMATHVIVPAYDPNAPVSLSPIMINGVLRGQLGYQGVVITDGMDMQGMLIFMQQHGFSDPAQATAEASVLALLAGNDMVELPIEPDRVAAVVASVTQAVQSGRISAAQFRQSLRRVIRLKAQIGLITLP